MQLKTQSKLIIIVIYKCDLSDSETLKSLLKVELLTGNDKIVVWDNSPIGATDFDISVLKKLKCDTEYLHYPENIPLSVAYNNSIKANSGFDYVIVLDQDSSFDNDFFEKFELSQKQFPDIMLFLPLIYHDKQIVSPGHYLDFKGKYWDKPQLGVVKSANNVAIASGLVINMECIRQLNYFEERLILYGIDTNFMIRYSRLYKEFFVLDARFKHDLSVFNNEDISTKLRRFQNHKKAALFNSKLFPIGIQFFAKIYYLYKSFVYSIKYRSIDFLK